MCQLMAQMRVVTVHDARAYRKHLRDEHGMKAYYIPK